MIRTPEILRLMVKRLAMFNNKKARNPATNDTKARNPSTSGKKVRDYSFNDKESRYFVL